MWVRGLRQRPFPCVPAATTTSSSTTWAKSWTRRKRGPSAKWTWNARPTVVHEGAIYMHLARSFLVEHLDWEGRIAYVRPVEVDYYTRASVGSSHPGTAGGRRQSIDN
jgi:hypothetical protein